MELITKEISLKLQEQYPKGSDFEQQVIVKLFDPCGSWTWYIMNQDPKDSDCLWAIVDGFEVEMGSVSLSELESYRNKTAGLGIERDLHFSPIPAREVWERLNKGEHI